MSRTYTAGIVTAYGAACRAGYTGTYDDFCEQQAAYAQNAAAVETAKNAAASSATAAAESATAAAGSASEADSSATAAAGSATAAAGSATAAGTSETNAANSATAAAGSATAAASSATAAASSAAAVQAVEESIPADYSQLSADVTQVKADLDGIDDLLTYTENVDFANVVTISGLVNTSNKWSTTSRFYSYKLPVPDNSYKVSITAASDKNAIISFFTNDTPVSGNEPPFCVGTGKNVIPQNTTSIFDIPDDCAYIVVTKIGSNNVDFTPVAMSFVFNKIIPEIDETLTLTGEAAGAKATGDRFASIENLLYRKEEAQLYGSYKVTISSTNKWAVNSNASSCIVPIPSSSKKITVTANETNVAVIAFLTSTAHDNATIPDFAADTQRIVIAAGQTSMFYIPAGAIYLYVMNYIGDVVYAPAAIMYDVVQDFQNLNIPLGLHENPANEDVLNIIKRCRQLTDITWTPAVDLPRYMLVQRGGAPIPDTSSVQNYLGTFKAGVEYKGVPYGRVSQTVADYGYDYGTVGNYIGFDTFISSISNPKSRLSKENVGSVSGHRSVIYATVCSGLTCYALNVSEVPTASIGNISGLSLIGKLNDDGVLLSDDMIKIGDILNMYNYHTAIITDIIRDSDGVIQLVELSDASTAGLADRNYNDGKIGGLCRRKGWTREQLYDISSPTSWGNYSVYRYSGRVDYSSSPYVNVGDEFDGWRIEHFPIMPYEGEGFVYKSGYIPSNVIKLVIMQGGYSYVRVFKDGAEVTGSPFAVTTTNDEIDDVNVTEIGVGDYTAYLCNITNDDVVQLTYACHWKVVN